MVERVKDDGRSAICKDMFKKETDLSLFQVRKMMCRWPGVCAQANRGTSICLCAGCEQCLVVPHAFCRG